MELFHPIYNWFKLGPILHKFPTVDTSYRLLQKDLGFQNPPNTLGLFRCFELLKTKLQEVVLGGAFFFLTPIFTRYDWKTRGEGSGSKSPSENGFMEPKYLAFRFGDCTPQSSSDKVIGSL